jgi:hypothetical protein
MERFAAALKSGDMETAVTLQKSGNVNLHHPLTVLPESPYPVCTLTPRASSSARVVYSYNSPVSLCPSLSQIHCAAGSGNLKLLQWLVEDLRCGTKDVHTGDALTTSAGLTVLGVAARQGHLSIMRYAVHSLGCSTSDLTDMAVLQRGLHAALEVRHQCSARACVASPLLTMLYYFVIYCSTGARSHAVTHTEKASAHLEPQLPPLRAIPVRR